MKNNRLLQGIIFLAGCFALAQAQADYNNGGYISMNGSIVDTACAIAMDSQEQTIDMGMIPLAVIRNEGEAPHRDVDIYLVNCDLAKFGKPEEEWASFRMTFDGPAEDGLFKVFGAAGGVALQMQDENQRHIIPGQALNEQPIVPPSMRLRYQLKLVSNNRPLRAGTFQSIIRFKVDYY